jgi:hypothetical protein
VNPVSEQDLERLEDYLDGTLAPDESVALHARLADDADLDAALGELAEQRASRAAAWATLEPTQDAADRFAERVIAATRRQERQSRLWRAGRFGTAAAACVLLGLFMGWLGRDRDNPATLTNTFDPGVGVVVGPPVPMPAPVPAASLGVLVREIQFPDPPRQPRPMLVVSEVTTPAQVGGPGLQVGDLLLSVDGERVPNVPALAAAVANRRGMRVLRILRDGQVHEVAIRFEQH